MTTTPAILAEGLHKAYGKTHALNGLDLEIAKGRVLGVLGPNGAGKTTAVRILTTLLKPDSGRAEIAGLDVVKHATAVRAQIGLTGQSAAVDETLTGSENLTMFGQLAHLSSRVARQRARTLLEQLDLTEAASRLVKTYSGGMRRRLDLAASLILSPPILFLDEPTTGLDPRGRLAVWEVIGSLVTEGHTVLLTTQYLEEVDQFAHQIVVIDQGRVIVRGTADELKAQIGGERLELTMAPGSDLQTALQVVRPYSSGEIQVESSTHHLAAPVTQGARQLAAIIRDLDTAGILLDDLALRRPTLDDVFLTLTGHVSCETPPSQEALKSGARERKAG